jgi:hypothetical protein
LPKTKKCVILNHIEQLFFTTKSMSTPNSNQPQPPATMIDPSIRLFLDDLLDEKGIFFSSPETREQMIQDLYLRLQKFFLLTLAQELSPADGNQLAQMIENQAPESTIQAFLQLKIPNLQDKLVELFLTFRSIYLSNN